MGEIGKFNTGMAAGIKEKSDYWEKNLNRGFSRLE
jgi:hypothetical protein